MSQQKTPTSKLTLEQVRGQFEAWRVSRPSRAAIPEALWQAAVELSEDYPIYQISRELRLNYTVLKNRVETSRSTGVPGGMVRSGFVELGFGNSISQAQCVVEMEDNSGAKMKIHIKGNSDLDLLSLAKAFWIKAL